MKYQRHEREALCALSPSSEKLYNINKVRRPSEPSDGGEGGRDDNKMDVSVFHSVLLRLSRGPTLRSDTWFSKSRGPGDGGSVASVRDSQHTYLLLKADTQFVCQDVSLGHTAACYSSFESRLLQLFKEDYNVKKMYIIKNTRSFPAKKTT